MVYELAQGTTAMLVTCDDVCMVGIILRVTNQPGARRHLVAKLAASARWRLLRRWTIWIPDAAFARKRVVILRNLQS